VQNPNDLSTTGETPLRCDCGYPCQGETLAEVVKDGQRHALEAHGIEVSADQIQNQMACSPTRSSNAQQTVE
jgi:predicted small metal-binding protein